MWILSRLRHDMECSPLKRAVAALLLGALIGAVVHEPASKLLAILSAAPHPVQYLAVSVEPTTIAPGGEVVITYRIDRDRSCPAEIHHFWVTAEGEAIARLPMVEGGYTQPGLQDVPVRLTVPENAPSGPLAYRFTITSYCETGTFVQAGPDAWVQVEAS